MGTHFRILQGGGRDSIALVRMLAPTIGLLAVAIVLATAGCGGDDDSVSQEDAAQQAKEAAQDARQQAKLEELEKELAESKDDEDSSEATQTPPSSAPPAGAGSGSDCGGGVRAGPNTSCAFALNVAAEYRATGGGTRISVHSPTTGQTYRMTCSTGSPNVCTGGNNASVYIP